MDEKLLKFIVSRSMGGVAFKKTWYDIMFPTMEKLGIKSQAIQWFKLAIEKFIEAPMGFPDHLVPMLYQDDNDGVGFRFKIIDVFFTNPSQYKDGKDIPGLMDFAFGPGVFDLVPTTAVMAKTATRDDTALVKSLLRTPGYVVPSLEFQNSLADVLPELDCLSIVMGNYEIKESKKSRVKALYIHVVGSDPNSPLSILWTIDYDVIDACVMMYEEVIASS